MYKNEEYQKEQTEIITFPLWKLRKNTIKVRKKPVETGFFGISLDISHRNVYYNYKSITKQIQRNYTAIWLINKSDWEENGICTSFEAKSGECS